MIRRLMVGVVGEENLSEMAEVGKLILLVIGAIAFCGTMMYVSLKLLEWSKINGL